MVCAGSLYDLLTLRMAYGVSLYGEATEEYSWFPGYAWTLAYCRGCSAHLVSACYSDVVVCGCSMALPWPCKAITSPCCAACLGVLHYLRSYQSVQTAVPIHDKLHGPGTASGVADKTCRGSTHRPCMTYVVLSVRQGWLFRAVDPQRLPRHFWGFKRSSFTVHGGMHGPHSSHLRA